MPPVIAAIAEVFVDIGFTAASASAIATTIVLTAAEMAISAVVQALSPKPKTATGTSLESNYYDPEAGLVVIFGSVRIGGMETIPPVTSQSDGTKLHKVLTVAGHKVAGYWEAYANDKIIHLPKIGAIAGNTNDGVVTETAFEVKGNPHLWMRRYDGSQTSVDWKLNNEVDSAGFPASFIGRGIANCIYELQWDQNVWSAGVPTFTNIVQGALCYDPRQDSTNGGTGSQRYNNASTWAWSENPAVCLATYLLQFYGGDYDPTEIDWASVAAAANTCDALVNVPSSFTTYVPNTHATVSGQQFTTTAGSWTGGVYSSDGHSSAVSVSCKVNAGDVVQLGYNDSASLSITASGNALFWITWSTGTSYLIGKALTTLMTVTSMVPAAGDVVRIDYDGSFVRFFVNNICLYTISIADYGFTAGSTTLYLNWGARDSGVTSTLNIQKRYTCNGALKSTNDFTSNIKSLLSSMTGRALYTNGVWRIFAGGWQTPTYTLSESDWVGPNGLKFQFDGGRDYRFNRGRSWYIDPNKNWQRTESYPRVNNTYYAADGSEWIDLQTDFPFCLTSYESQRQCEFLLRQSRNQVRLTGKLPPRWQVINLWDTVFVNHALLGWSNKTFRVSQCTINPDSSVDVVLSEENSSDWNDLNASDYNALDTTPLQPINTVAPRAPTALTAISNVNGTIDVQITPQVGMPLNVTYQVWGSVNCVTVPTSGVLIADGPATFFRCPAPTSANFYWTRAYVNIDTPGPFYPTTYGVVGTAGGIDTGQITPGAATGTGVLNTAGPVTVPSASYGAMCGPFAVGPYLTDVTLMIFFTCAWDITVQASNMSPSIELALGTSSGNHSEISVFQPYVSTNNLGGIAAGVSASGFITFEVPYSLSAGSSVSIYVNGNDGAFSARLHNYELTGMLLKVEAIKR